MANTSINKIIFLLMNEDNIKYLIYISIRILKQPNSLIEISENCGEIPCIDIQKVE